MGRQGDSQVEEFLILKVKWDAWGTYIVVVDVDGDKEVYANVYGLDTKVR